MFYTYFIEIKNRLMLITLSWLFTFFIAYFYKETALFLIIKSNLINFTKMSFYFIATNITDLFYSYLDLSWSISFQFTIFFFLYHLLLFLSPGLFKIEYLSIRNKIFSIFLTWLIVSTMFNKYINKKIYEFFINFQTTYSKTVQVYFEAQVTDYVNMYCLNSYLVNILSQILLLILLYLNNIRDKSAAFVKKTRKVFYSIFLIQATIITPPEIMSQIFVWLILVLSFEIVIVAIIFRNNILG
jgi:sec-independent protein translocase protein TatC